MADFSKYLASQARQYSFFRQERHITIQNFYLRYRKHKTDSVYCEL